MTRQTNSPKKPVHVKPTRLLVISFIAAVALISLPIIPLRLGTGGPIGVPDLAQIVDLGKSLWGYRPAQRKMASTRHPAVSRRASQGLALQVTSLESCLHGLLAQAAKAPQEPALQNQIGLVYLALGEPNESLAHFHKAVDLSRVALLNLEERQHRLQDQGKAAEASPLFVESARINIELSAAHSNLARTYEKLGQHEKGMAELDALNKEGVISIQAVGKDSARRHLSSEVARHLAAGESLMLSRQYGQAMQEFKNVIAVDPAVALAHHQLGLAAALTNDAGMAIEEFQQAVKLTPSDAIAHNNLGLAWQATGEIDQAERQFCKAVTLEPKLADAAINLANLHCLQQQYGKASQCLEQAVLRSPNSAVAHNNLAAVLSLQGKYPDAIKEFHRSISLAPNMASAHYGLGLALMQLKKYLPAISELKRAVTLDPRLSGAYDKLEQAHRKVGLVSGGSCSLN